VIPDERTAPTVKRIFELYTSGRLGTAAIARQLADEQAPAPPAGWQPAIVQLVWQNEAYLGRVLWRGESLPGKHEPLLDELSFQRAQRVLRERGEDMALRRNPSDYLLSGLVRCGRCRRAYVGMSARGNGGLYHYYACSGRQKLGRKGCDGERIPRDKLEAAVIHQLAALYRDGTLIREAQHAATAKALQASLQSRNSTARSPTRRAAPNADSPATTQPSKPASSTRPASRRACLPSRRASPPYASKRPALAEQLAPEAATAPDAAELAAVADNLETTIATAEPRQAKALLRLLIKRPPRQRQIGNPPDLPRRHARGLRTAKFSGMNQDRTSRSERIRPRV
jgi:site-specific DNA recombinase